GRRLRLCVAASGPADVWSSGNGELQAKRRRGKLVGVEEEPGGKILPTKAHGDGSWHRLRDKCDGIAIDPCVVGAVKRAVGAGEFEDRSEIALTAEGSGIEADRHGGSVDLRGLRNRSGVGDAMAVGST